MNGLLMKMRSNSEKNQRINIKLSEFCLKVGHWGGCCDQYASEEWAVITPLCHVQRDAKVEQAGTVACH